MEALPHVLIRWQGKTTGPFSLEQLRELVRAGAVTPATEAASEAAGPWTRLDTLPIGAALFSAFTFKNPTFDRANTCDSPPIDLRDIIAAAHRPVPPAGCAAPTKIASAPHDVAELLCFNHEVEKKHGRFRLVQKLARPSRRRHDYFLLLLCVGALIFLVLGFESVLAVSLQTLAARMPDQFWPILGQVLFHSPILAWGVAMFAFYAIALTWLMFGLMDDY